MCPSPRLGVVTPSLYQSTHSLPHPPRARVSASLPLNTYTHTHTLPFWHLKSIHTPIAAFVGIHSRLYFHHTRSFLKIACDPGTAEPNLSPTCRNTSTRCLQVCSPTGSTTASLASAASRNGTRTLSTSRPCAPRRTPSTSAASTAARDSRPRKPRASTFFRQVSSRAFALLFQRGSL